MSPVWSQEEAQKDKTSVIKNTDSPGATWAVGTPTPCGKNKRPEPDPSFLPLAEFKEQFKLCINRSHRGFRRAIQTKGIKFEVVHKG